MIRPHLHVLNGLHAAGIESLAFQLIRHAPIGVQNKLLNTDLAQQDQAPVVQQLLVSDKLAAFYQWHRCDGLLMGWRSFRLCLLMRPDVVFIYPFNRPMLWFTLGARLAGVRRISVHLGNTAPVSPAGRRLYLRLLRWFHRLGVVPVPCSEAIVASLQPLSQGLYLAQVIPNGCEVADIAIRAAAERATRPPQDVHRVLMVARLDPIKDQGTLLRAFAAVFKSGWQLQLVGEGPERATLEALALELGLDPVQVFLGRRSDIPELLGQADLFAFSTTAAEGFGIALIEALAAGLPVIASDVPACREVLKGGAAGDLLPAGDVAAWARRLAELMASSEQRQGLAVRAEAYASSYDIRHTAEQWYRMLTP